MRLVHFSDQHWSFEKLPEADLYVCTGDELDNYPTRIPDRPDPPPHPPAWRWGIDPVHERGMQKMAIERFVARSGFRELLGSPDAPVVCVRGNHDFVPLAPLFGGCNLVHEFQNNELIEVLGLRITGHRGIPFIYGTWSDEMSRPDLLDKARAMPRADVYVTHYPPTVLDGIGTARYGLEGLLNELVYREEGVDFSRPPRALHLFGHIHECGGRTHNGGGVLFSNAATGCNVLEGSPADGWVAVMNDV